MSSMVKKVFNAARTRLGMTPLIVTTSKGDCKVTSDSPLLELFGARNTTMTETKPGRFIAEAMDGLKSPENQTWKITTKVDGYGTMPWQKTVTYSAMLDFMKARELYVAREAGFSGTDAEIIAKRKPAVANNNVLKFV